MSPNATSIPGATEFFVVLTAPELCNHSTIAMPTVTLVVSAPAR